MLAVFDASHDLFLGSGITRKLISNDHARHILEPFEQFPKEFFSSVLAAATLHQNIENVAILINRSPEIMSLSIDLEIHFIQVPLVSCLTTTAFEFIGVRLPEFEAPLPNRFLG